MQPTMIFLPAAAMVLLTAVVTFLMFFERVRQVKSEKIPFRDIPSGSQMAARFADTRAADNYRNLFEAPVLFYLALVVAFASVQVTAVTLGLAWTYVALRAVHSYVHCGYNRVSHRFYLFVAGNVLLWILWIVLLAGLLRA